MGDEPDRISVDDILGKRSRAPWPGWLWNAIGTGTVVLGSDIVAVSGDVAERGDIIVNDPDRGVVVDHRVSRPKTGAGNKLRAFFHR